jgi:hypothetical protein
MRCLASSLQLQQPMTARATPVDYLGFTRVTVSSLSADATSRNNAKSTADSAAGRL